MKQEQKTTPQNNQDIDYLVIGAGIVGVATAIWLQRAGHSVLLLDRDGPAAGTSFGNAGVIASGSVVPIPVPGLLHKIPKMVLSPNQPLFLRWLQLPRLLPFLIRYMQNASDKAVEKISRGLHLMLHDALLQHQVLAKDTPAAQYLSAEPFLFGYLDQEDFAADSYSWAVRKQRGVPYDVMDQAELAAYDSVLAEQFSIAVQIHDNGKVSDPGAYVKALADHFIAEGGQFLQAELQSFALNNSHCQGVQTNKGLFSANGYILTTGVQSGVLSETLGIHIPLESERGYHVEYHQPSITLRSPIMVAAEKFVATSMNGRLRCAGIVEFGGVASPPSKAPIDLIKRKVEKVFPKLRYSEMSEWLGHRPATPDSLPVIGAAPAAKNVYVGYGHQHIGLSGGPKTGRWLAALATGKAMQDDLSMYAPDRKSVVKKQL